MKKTVLRYGAISGAISIALMVFTALYLRQSPDNFKNSEIIGYVGILLSMSLVFLGVRAYRDQVAGGTLSFGKGFQIGLLITLISCVCYVVSWMVVSKIWMPDFMEQFMQYSLNQMKSAGASAEEISKKAAEMEQFKAMYQNPLVSAALIFLEPFPVGLLVTLISAGVLRRS